VVANKCDSLDPDYVDVKAFESYVKDELGCELIYVSAATGENLDELVSLCARRLADLPPMLVYESEYEPEQVFESDARETTIRRENNTFFVEGEWLYNLMGQINFDDYESLNYFQKVLKNSGIFDMLEQKGCVDGNTVSIYDFEFDYVK
jgi:GTP-binding protein